MQEDDDDDLFERKSDDSMGKRLEVKEREKGDGEERLEFNGEDCWITSKKFERWIINEGQRPILEVWPDKKQSGNETKGKISKRLGMVMERILMNIMRRKMKREEKQGS